jgi:hypothetical protein
VHICGGGPAPHRNPVGRANTGIVAGSEDIRASDADRQRVAAILRRHCADGRLTLDELDERLTEVYAARTMGSLVGPAGPLRDLPDLAPPPPEQVIRMERRPVPAMPVRFLPEHIAAYVAVNVLLVVSWALSGAGTFWPLWIILIWGAALAAHGALARHERRRSDASPR